VEGLGVDNFKSLVKSFLLLTGMKYSHNTVTGGEVCEAYFDREVGLRAYTRPDLLILVLGRDGKSGAYRTVLPSLLTQRVDIGNKMTFIFSYTPLKSHKFSDSYGTDLVEIIDSSFNPVALKN